MATRKNQAGTAEPKAAKSVSKSEPVYTIREFAAGAEKVFGTAPDIVRAALMEKGINKCTKAEAVKIVDAFKNKEVK